MDLNLLTLAVCGGCGNCYKAERPFCPVCQKPSRECLVRLAVDRIEVEGYGGVRSVVSAN